MQKIGVAFSGPIYVSHQLLFKTVLSFMIICKAKLRACWVINGGDNDTKSPIQMAKVTA